MFVNHETSTVPFPYVPTAPTITNSQNDFDNSQVSLLTLDRRNASVLAGSYAIPSGANYQRLCSSFLADEEHGFSRPILFTNEEATDLVNRTGTAWPATPGAEQAGVVVAHDVRSGQYRTIYGMGRFNHENSVALEDYDELVLRFRVGSPSRPRACTGVTSPAASRPRHRPSRPLSLRSRSGSSRRTARAHRYRRGTPSDAGVR